jgi:hypothetical protein
MMINTSQLTFEDQLTDVGFTGVTSEIFNNSTLKSSYIDVNAGVLYNGSTTDRNNFYFGVSLYHINSPKQDFTGGLYRLSPRATLHAGTYFPLGEDGNITLHLSGIQSFQGGASETVLGGAFQFSVNNDTVIPYLGLEYDNFRLGTTYDVNTSSLKTASQGIGGIEVSLIYIYKPSSDKPINCPKF